MFVSDKSGRIIVLTINFKRFYRFFISNRLLGNSYGIFQVLFRLHDAADYRYFIEESQIIELNKLRCLKNPGLLNQTSQDV